jgi:hypothetical protein
MSSAKPWPRSPSDDPGLSQVASVYSDSREHARPTGIGDEVLTRLDDLVALVTANPDIHVRYSMGFEHDMNSRSMDAESGLPLPGLSVNPLGPEAWWTRPLRDWIARQLCQYMHLRAEDPERHAWILQGTCAGRGPDCEPLLTDVDQIARLSDDLLSEAQTVYQDRFDVGARPGAHR